MDAYRAQMKSSLFKFFFFSGSALLAAIVFSCSKSDRPLSLFDGESLANWEIQSNDQFALGSEVHPRRGRG